MKKQQTLNLDLSKLYGYKIAGQEAKAITISSKIGAIKTGDQKIDKFSHLTASANKQAT